MPVKIIARSRSQDPMQEHLRERKQVWNKACSEFIARLNTFKPHLISFKRGLNGRGDPKAGIPTSNIKDPLPPEISGFLGQRESEFSELASTFDALVREAVGIMQEQTHYSSKRRKAQPKQQAVRPVQQMVANTSLENDALIVEASSALSRFWAHLSSLVSSDVSKTQRLSMLSLANKLFKHMVDFEDVVLSKGVDNVPQVLSKYLLAFNNFQALKESMKMLAETALMAQHPTIPPNPTHLPNSPGKTPATSQIIPPTQTDNSNKPKQDAFTFPSEAGDLTPEELKRHVVNMKSFGLSDEDIRPFLDIFHQRRKEKNENKKDLMSDRLKDIYQDLFKKVVVTKTSELLSDIEITKQSGNYLTRLLKKYRHQFGTKEPSSAARMEIYELIRNIKILLDETMDLLEKKKINIKQVIDKVSEVDKLFTKMEGPLKILNMLYSDKYYERDNLRRQPVVDPLGRHFNRQIRRNVDNLGR